MSHTKTHIARAFGVMSLLVGLMAFGGTPCPSRLSATLPGNARRAPSTG